MTSTTDWVDTAVGRLLAPLTDEQTALLRVVADAQTSRQVWPIWQYVDEVMARRGTDAARVISTMPSVPGNGPQSPRYTLVSYGGSLPAKADQRIILTVAGLAHLRDLDPVLDTFLRCVRVLAAGRARTVFNPDKVIEVVVAEDDLINTLAVGPQQWLRLLPDLVAGEPYVWLTQHFPGNDTLGVDDPGRYPSWRPGKYLDAFADCADVEDYLGRLAALMQPPAPPAPMVAASPLDLATGLDYLDVVWRLKFSQGLLVLPGAEKTTRIAFDAATAEEFDNRLTALGDILSNLNTAGLPGTNGKHPVARLIAALANNCPGIDTERLETAHLVLKAAVDLRNGAQHHDKKRQSIVGALATFGLAFPILDYVTAWRVITAAVVEALRILREAIQATLPT